MVGILEIKTPRKTTTVFRHCEELSNLKNIKWHTIQVF